MSNNSTALTQYAGKVNWRNHKQALAELKNYSVGEIMSPNFRAVPNVNKFISNGNTMKKFINNDPLLAQNKYIMEILVYASISKKILSLGLALTSTRVYKALGKSARNRIIRKIQEKPETAELLGTITNGQALLNRMNMKSLQRTIDGQVKTLTSAANANVAARPRSVKSEAAWKREVRNTEGREADMVKMLDTCFNILGSFILAMQMFQILSMEIVSEMNSFTSLNIGDVDHMRHIVMQYVTVISKLSPLLSEAAATGVIQAMQRLFGVLGPVKKAAIQGAVTVVLAGPLVGGKTIGTAMGSFILSGVDSFNQDFRTWILKLTGQTGTGGLWLAKQGTVAANGGMLSKVLRGAFSVQTNKNAIRAAESFMYQGYELMAEKMTTFALILVMTVAFSSSVASASEATMSRAMRSRGIMGNVANSTQDAAVRGYGRLLQLTGNTAKQLLPSSAGKALNRRANNMKRIMPGSSKALGLNNRNNRNNSPTTNNRNNRNNSPTNNNSNNNRNNSPSPSPSPSPSNRNNNSNRNSVVSNSNNNTANRRRRSRGASPSSN